MDVKIRTIAATCNTAIYNTKKCSYKSLFNIPKNYYSYYYV